MSFFTRLSCLLSALLVSFLGTAQSVKPEIIVTDAGGTAVFNTSESFFAIDLTGDDLQPAPNTDGFFQIDARLVRLTNTPLRVLTKTAGQRVLMPKELLQMQYRRDLEDEQLARQQPVTGAQQEFITTPKGRVVLHWWFTPPGGTAKEIAQRHYMSTVCDREVLTLCAPLLPTDTPAALRQYLADAMATVRESDDPINVREYAKELKSEK